MPVLRDKEFLTEYLKFTIAMVGQFGETVPEARPEGGPPRGRPRPDAMPPPVIIPEHRVEAFMKALHNFVHSEGLRYGYRPSTAVVQQGIPDQGFGSQFDQRNWTTTYTVPPGPLEADPTAVHCSIGALHEWFHLELEQDLARLQLAEGLTAKDTQTTLSYIDSPETLFPLPTIEAALRQPPLDAGEKKALRGHYEGTYGGTRRQLGLDRWRPQLMEDSPHTRWLVKQTDPALRDIERRKEALLRLEEVVALINMFNRYPPAVRLKHPFDTKDLSPEQQKYAAELYAPLAEERDPVKKVEHLGRYLTVMGKILGQKYFEAYNAYVSGSTQERYARGGEALYHQVLGFAPTGARVSIPETRAWDGQALKALEDAGPMSVTFHSPRKVKPGLEAGPHPAIVDFLLACHDAVVRKRSKNLAVEAALTVARKKAAPSPVARQQDADTHAPNTARRSPPPHLPPPDPPHRRHGVPPR